MLVLALQSLLAVVGLLDAFHVTYFPMIHRATFTKVFSLGFSLAPALLVLSSITIAYLLVCGRFWEVIVLSSASLGLFFVSGIGLSAAVLSVLLVAVTLLRFRGFQDYVFWVLVLLTGFEGLALLHWILLPFGVASPLAWFASLELSLFYVAAYLAPLLVLPLMFMWALRPLVEWGWGKKWDSEKRTTLERKGPSRRWLLLLAFSLVLAVVAALYSYGKVVNPEGRGVGVDIPHYVKNALIVESDPSLAFRVWGGSRPLIFLVIYGFQRVLGSDVSTAVKFLPVLLNPLIVISTFFLALEVFRNEWMASWASFFTVCGFHVTVGMYSYFLTNMLGLVLVFFSLGFLFRSMRCGCRLSLGFACLSGGLLLFTHPWTFDQYIAAAVLTAGLMLYGAYVGGGDYVEVKTMLVYVASLGLVELLKAFVFRGVGGLSASGEVVRRLSQLSEFWVDSIFSFRLLYGGTLSVVVLLGLAVVGVYLWRSGGVPGLYFNVFFAVTSALFLIGDETIKGRLLFNVPVGLFAALGFTLILRWRCGEDVKKAFTLFVVSNSSAYLLRSLANLL